MGEAASKEKEVENFEGGVARRLVPVFEECFSGESRKVGNYLLVSSALLFLSIVGLVNVEMRPVPVGLLGLEFTIKTSVYWVLLALCCYLEVVFLARTYVEWRRWQLKQKGPRAELGEMGNNTLREAANIDKLRPEIGRRLEAAAHDIQKAAGRPEIATLDASLKALARKQDALYEKIRSRETELGALDPERHRTSEESRRIYADLNDLHGQHDATELEFYEVLRQREEEEKRATLAREPAQLRLQEAIDELARVQTGVETARHRLNFLANETRNLHLVVGGRLLVECLFPLLVGLAAIGFAVGASATR